MPYDISISLPADEWPIVLRAMELAAQVTQAQDKPTPALCIDETRAEIASQYHDSLAFKRGSK